MSRKHDKKRKKKSTRERCEAKKSKKLTSSGLPSAMEFVSPEAQGENLDSRGTVVCSGGIFEGGIYEGQNSRGIKGYPGDEARGESGELM